MLSLDVESFNQALEGAQGLVIVDFWAPWCGPCRTVTPILEDIEAEYHRSEEAGVEFYKVNVEEVPSLMEAFKLSSIPAVLILKPYEEGGGARVLDALIGARSPASYIQVIERHLHPQPGPFARMIKFLSGHKS
jgi:thioredoxin